MEACSQSPGKLVWVLSTRRLLLEPNSRGQQAMCRKREPVNPGECCYLGPARYHQGHGTPPQGRYNVAKEYHTTISFDTPLSVLEG